MLGTVVAVFLVVVVETGSRRKGRRVRDLREIVLEWQARLLQPRRVSNEKKDDERIVELAEGEEGGGKRRTLLGIHELDDELRRTYFAEDCGGERTV